MHSIAGVWKGIGGPSESVPALCAALAECGNDVVLLTGEGDLSAAATRVGDVATLRTVRLGSYLTGHFSREYSRACLEEAARCHVVHDHGLWLMTNLASAKAARSNNRPFVSSPRGMLSRDALGRSRWKKRAAWWLFQRNNLHKADLIHVTSTQEGEQVRDAGIRAPLAVIGNGVDIEAYRPPQDAGGSRDTDRIQVLYLGRIHPIKGLDQLFAAWRAGSLADRADLVIAGSGSPAALSWLSRQLQDAVGAGVRFMGQIGEEQKVDLLHASDLLILPSYSENYGMAVAEALASGTPVIASTGTPWAAVSAAGCGWWVEPKAEALLQALEAALLLGPEELAEMGRKGIRLAEEEHSVQVTAARLSTAYRWLLDMEPKPEWVDT